MVIEQGLPVRVGLLLVSEADLNAVEAADAGEDEGGVDGQDETGGAGGGGGGDDDGDDSRPPQVRRVLVAGERICCRVLVGLGCRFFCVLPGCACYAAMFV